jgi:uncharacterized protein
MSDATGRIDIFYELKLNRTMDTPLRKRRQTLRNRRYTYARQKLGQAAAYLYEEGAQEVLLFGSIVDPERFTEHSDVDLAVRGIPEEKRLEVEGKLEDIFGDLEYDIVFLEEAEFLRKELSKKIEEEAVLWSPDRRRRDRTKIYLQGNRNPQAEERSAPERAGSGEYRFSQ